MAPRWLKIGLCCLKLAPRCPRRPPNASQVPQDEAKMASRWLPNRYVLASWCFFRNLLPDLLLQRFFTFRELGKHQFSTILGAKSDEMSIILAILGRVCPKKPQDWSKMVYLSQSGPHMGPSCLQVGSTWTYVGPKLAPTWLMLGLCWPQIRVPSRP